MTHRQTLKNWREKIGLRHIRPGWVHKADYDKLQPKIDKAVSEAADVAQKLKDETE